MRRRALRVVLSALLLAAAPSARAQHAGHAGHDAAGVAAPPADSATLDFLRRARAGAERYADQALAVADGYRRVGLDFPAMGEHWVNPELVARGEVDPAHPALLTYVHVGGVPRLTGVVFALPLGEGEAPPAQPAGVGAWHDHVGSIDEESLLLTHGAEHVGPGELRLAVLHAWLFVANPAGPFVTDNWALPYARLGVPAATGAPMAATRALALMSGGLEYYAALAERAAATDDAGNGRIRAVLARHRDRIAAWWGERSGGALSAAELATLSGMWTACWDEVATGLSGDARQRMRVVSGEVEG